MQNIAVRRDRQRRGIGRGAAGDAARRGRAGAAPAVLLEVAVDNAPAQRLYDRYGFEPVGVRSGYYQPSNTDALVMRQAWRRDADEPLVLGIETSCDETGVGIVRGHTLLADAVASSVDAARPVRRRGAGGGQPRPPGGDGARRCSARSTTAGVTPRRHRRDRGHRRPGAGRRAAGRGRRGQGVRARRRASRSTA